MHKITVTVWTERGQASQTTYFSINENASTTNNPIPTIPVVVAGSIGGIAVVGFGLLVYFKKRKH
jgi:LPXTG-motif cell wall-anchored protein